MKNNLEQILNCLREANAERMLVDTIWMDDDQTLFDFIERCIEEAALTQQQEAEPVACEVVGRHYHESFGNGVRLKLYIDAHQWPITEAIPIGTKLYFNPPRPAAQPQVPEGFRSVDIVNAGFEGCINLFWKDYPLALVPKEIAHEIKAVLSAAKEEGK